MKILLTGFDPFGGEAVNPSWEAVKRVRDVIGNAEIVKLQIPTVFGKGASAVLDKAKEIRPDVVLATGQAGRRAAISVELVAINYADAGIQDNEGNMPQSERILPAGENAYFSSLPVKAMVAHIQSRGLPAVLSTTAGTFVCNEVFYRVLHEISRAELDIRAGFIHVPYIQEQVAEKPEGTPAMLLEEIVNALEYAIEAVL